MNAHCGIFRTDAGLREAQAGMAKLRREMEAAPKSGFSPYSFEAWNLLAAAESVAAGAIARRTNVGLHFNEDLAQSAGTESPEPGT
ncbi:MAG: hypothetical protein MH204_03910 [Fimbriimonadaceae bacterium]|nr:hypothetical protein [Fimbriimonadaceae bacterium]